MPNNDLMLLLGYGALLADDSIIQYAFKNIGPLLYSYRNHDAYGSSMLWYEDVGDEIPNMMRSITNDRKTAIIIPFSSMMGNDDFRDGDGDLIFLAHIVDISLHPVRSTITELDIIINSARMHMTHD